MSFFFFFTPSSTFVYFPILVFDLLFVSSHVGLYLIIVLLFLCQQFILLPCHLIMCCVNSVLLRHHSLRMMVLSGVLTCVDVCSFIGISAQVNTLHLGLCGLFSEDHTPAVCLSVCVPLPLPVYLVLFRSLFVRIFSFTDTQISQNNNFLPRFFTIFMSDSLCFSLCLYLSPTGIICSPSLMCSQLSTILICRSFWIVVVATI